MTTEEDVRAALLRLREELTRRITELDRLHAAFDPTGGTDSVPPRLRLIRGEG